MTHRIASLLMLVAMLAGACGIPTDAAPRAVELDERGENSLVLLPDATRIPVAFIPEAFSIYLINADSRLVPVTRALPVDSGPEEVIRSLFQGPTPEEAAENLTTALADNQAASILSVTTTSGTVILNVAEGSFEDLPTQDDLRKAIAQIVFTVSDLSKVSSLRLQVEGVDTELPTDGSNSAEQDPVARSDYASLEALPEEDEEPPAATDGTGPAPLPDRENDPEAVDVGSG